MKRKPYRPLYSDSESKSDYAYIKQRPRHKKHKDPYSSYSDIEESEVEKPKPKARK